MKGLFFILGLLLSINAFSQTEANIEAIRGIINEESMFDTTSNKVIQYINDYITKENCVCVPNYDEKTKKPLDYGSSFFEVNDLGEKSEAYIYVKYFTKDSITNEEIISKLPENMEKDFEEFYVNDGLDYFGIYNTNNFNFKIVNVKVKELITYMDSYTFLEETEEVFVDYKAIILIAYND